MMIKLTAEQADGIAAVLRDALRHAEVRNKIAYSLSEAAGATGLSIDTLRKEIRQTLRPPFLRAKRYGNKVLILRADLEQWMADLPGA